MFSCCNTPWKYQLTLCWATWHDVTSKIYIQSCISESMRRGLSNSTWIVQIGWYLGLSKSVDILEEAYFYRLNPGIDSVTKSQISQKGAFLFPAKTSLVNAFPVVQMCDTFALFVSVWRRYDPILYPHGVNSLHMMRRMGIRIFLVVRFQGFS